MFFKPVIQQKLCVLALLLTWVSVGYTVAQDVRVELSQEERAYLDGLGAITVAPDPDWIPFEHIDEKGAFTGIAADLLELIAARLDISFSFLHPADWNEAVALSKEGKALILPFLNRTPERDAWLLFTEPLLVDPSVYITREEHPYVIDPARMGDQIIALPEGTSIEERVRGDFPNLKILLLEDERSVLQAIVDRRADFTLRSLTVSAHTIRKEGFINLKISGQGPENYTNRLRIGVVRGEPLLRDILDKAISTITFQERQLIVNRHVNITQITSIDYTLIIRISLAFAFFAAFSLYWHVRMRRINRALKESERSKSILLANLPGMAYKCRYDSEWTMIFVSEGCKELTGYTSDEIVMNRQVSYNDIIHPDDRQWIAQTWERAWAANVPAELEYRIITKSGDEKWVYEKGLVVCDPHEKEEMIEGIIIDISERKAIEQELVRISIHDHLTGLYNRRYIYDRLRVLIQEHERDGKPFSVAMIDLDFFKRVNDTWGHRAGDTVLREFARMLETNCRPYDLAGRFGGEEFIFIGVNMSQAETCRTLERFRMRLEEEPVFYEGTRIPVQFSAGISSSAEFTAPVDLEALIQSADRRLYAAKDAGRNRIVCGEKNREPA